MENCHAEEQPSGNVGDWVQHLITSERLGVSLAARHTRVNSCRSWGKNTAVTPARENSCKVRARARAGLGILNPPGCFGSLRNDAAVWSLKSCPSLCDPMDCSLHQAPLSTGFSRQEYWSGLPSPSPRDLPDPGINTMPPELVGTIFTAELPG